MKTEEEAIKQRFERVAGELNERTRRLVAESRGDGTEMGRDFGGLTSDGAVAAGDQGSASRN